MTALPAPGFGFMNRLIELWQELTLRERLLLMALVAVLALGLSYQIAWLPLSDAVETEKHRHTSLQQSLLRIETIIQQLPADSVKQQPVASDEVYSQPLLPLIDIFLKQTELDAKIVQIRALTVDTVELELEKVSFDGLIQWLARLKQEQAVSVAEIILQQGEKLGMVRVKMNLTRE